MAYLLDANVFIQAKNLHYGTDFCPAFWDWLIAKNASQEVFSIEKVGDELQAGGDGSRGLGSAVRSGVLPETGRRSPVNTGQGQLLGNESKLRASCG